MLSRPVAPDAPLRAGFILNEPAVSGNVPFDADLDDVIKVETEARDLRHNQL
jgi:hypothetical protein